MLALILGFAALGFFLGSISVLIFQGFMWLKHGVWLPLNALNIVSWLGGEAWAAWPMSWFGVHAALQWLSLSGALMILSVLALWASVAADQK